MIYAENILICIAVPLLVAIFFIRGSARRFALSFVIGMGICLLSAYISGFIELVSKMGAEDTSIYISPMVEEAMKLLPLLFYLYLFDPDLRGLFQTSIGIGAGFATFENCCQILTAGAGNLPFILVRGLAVGVMHVVSALFLAIGLMMVRRLRILSFSSIIGALSVSMTFHALYNLLVSQPGFTSYIGFAMPIVTAATLFIPYVRIWRPRRG